MTEISNGNDVYVIQTAYKGCSDALDEIIPIANR